MSNKIEYTYLWKRSEEEANAPAKVGVPVESFLTDRGFLNNSISIQGWHTHLICLPNDDAPLWRMLMEVNNDADTMTFHKPVRVNDNEPLEHAMNAKAYRRTDIKPQKPDSFNFNCWGTGELESEQIWVSEMNEKGEWSEPQKI